VDRWLFQLGKLRRAKHRQRDSTAHPADDNARGGRQGMDQAATGGARATY